MTALAQSIGTAFPSLAPLARAFAAWRGDAERREAYRRTRRELDRLSDRELDDLGISRWEIDAVAHRSVYGA